MHLKAAPTRSRSQPEQMISSSARALWPRNGWLWLGCLTDGFLEAIVAKILLFCVCFVILIKLRGFKAFIVKILR